MQPCQLCYLTQGTPPPAMLLGCDATASPWLAPPGAGDVPAVGDGSVPPEPSLVTRSSGMLKSAPSTTRRCPVGTVESRAVGNPPSTVAKALAVSAELESG